MTTKHTCAKLSNIVALEKDLANINRILIGNGTKGIIRKLEEVNIIAVKLNGKVDAILFNLKEEKKDKSRIDSWSRTKLIFLFGFLQGLFFIVATVIINNFASILKKIGG